MTCRAVGGNLQGWVVIDGVGVWLLVKTGRGGVEARTYWCVATSHALNVVDGVDGRHGWTAWMDGVDGRHGQSDAAEFELGRKRTQGETWSVHAQTLCI